MSKKSFFHFVRNGISFASQQHFLSIQVAYYLALEVAVLALVLLFAASLVHAFSSGGIGASVATAEKMFLRLGIIALAVGAVAWLAAKWLSLFFISSAKSFLQGYAANSRRDAVRLANSRFPSFIKATLLMGAVSLLGTIFFLLLESTSPIGSAASILGSIYALFFTLAFLFAPFHLGLGGKQVWQALSASFDSLLENPVRTLLLMLAAEVVEALSIAVSAIPLVLSALGLAWAVASNAGSLALVLLGALLLLSLVVLAAGISFANLAAIGMYCSAYLEGPAGKKKKN